MLRLVLLWLTALSLAVPATAQTFPKLTGRVVDQADLLDPAREAALSARLETLERETGRQLVVATVNSLEGRTIEDYGYRLGREWGIGSEEKDDGVVLLVAPNERRVRIETGYGARVFLTDAVSSVIIRNAILPRFREGDFAGGIEAGVDELVTQMRLPPEEAQRRVQEAEKAQATPQARAGGVGVLPLVFFALILLVTVGSFIRRGGGRRYRGKRRRGRGGIDPVVVLWGLDLLSHAARGGGGGGGGWRGGGGFGGGGGFSGGGGSFGGGGASGSW